MNVKYLFVLACLTSMTSKALGCSEPTWPDLENLDQYSEIFYGEVTAIDLKGYEAGKIHAQSNTKKLPDMDLINQGHHIRVLVTQQIKGISPNPFTTQIIGCGSEIPNPRMYGVFFVEERTKQVIPIYEHQGEIYQSSISAIASKFH